MDRLMRRGIRSQRMLVTAFMPTEDGRCLLITFNTQTGALVWSDGARPPLVEVIRSVEEIKATKVA